MPNVDGGSLWELVERRAAATPDALAAVDEDGRTLTWAEAKTEAERAAAGLARHGIGAGDVVSWQLPTWLESKLLVLALRSPGCHPEPDAPDLPRARGRLHHPPGARASCSWSRPPGRASTSRRWPRASRRRSPSDGGGPLEVLVADKALPQGDPSTLPPPPDPERRRGPLVLLHVGHHGRPEGRACTPTARSRPARWACASGSRSPTPT